MTGTVYQQNKMHSQETKTMKRSTLLAALVFAILSAAATANAQAASAAQQKPTFAAVYDRAMSSTEKEVVSAAEAMPEDKFNFAPANGEFKGVRTFAMQIKHIAAVNYMIGAAVMQEKPPVDLNNEAGPANITSKADTVKFLKDSFAYAHKSLAGLNESNLLEQVKPPWGDHPLTRLSLVTIMMSHPFDHYGQMVVYLRMNGIVPPASRAQ
jgi:uncharacterized damage-inducible protein DinB